MLSKAVKLNVFEKNCEVRRNMSIWRGYLNLFVVYEFLKIFNGVFSYGQNIVSIYSISNCSFSERFQQTLAFHANFPTIIIECCTKSRYANTK